MEILDDTGEDFIILTGTAKLFQCLKGWKDQFSRAWDPLLGFLSHRLDLHINDGYLRALYRNQGEITMNLLLKCRNISLDNLDAAIELSRR